MGCQPSTYRVLTSNDARTFLYIRLRGFLSMTRPSNAVADNRDLTNDLATCAVGVRAALLVINEGMQ